MGYIKTLTFFIVSLTLNAHPVIYKGGWVFQGSFMPEMNEMTASYSATSRYSFVANGNYFKNVDEYQDYTLGANLLLKRWLNSGSQGNLYAGAHAGYYQDNKNDGFTAHSFLMGDWESREHYVMARSKGYFYDGRENFDYLARYGFAPYKGGMNELQTWLILQAYYYEEQNKEVILTPMMRFFYKNALWEVGYSTRGQSYLTIMIHY